MSKVISQTSNVARGIIFLGILFLIGCSSTTKNTAPGLMNQDPSKETSQDVVSAVESVVGAVSGQPVSQDDLRKVATQVKNDPQAQSAVEAITGSLSADTPAAKYCPIDGKRYVSSFMKCPQHDILLKDIEP